MKFTLDDFCKIVIHGVPPETPNYYRVVLRNNLTHIELEPWCTVHFGVQNRFDPEPRWFWGRVGTGGRFVYEFRDNKDFMFFQLRWSEKVENFVVIYQPKVNKVTYG